MQLLTLTALLVAATISTAAASEEEVPQQERSSDEAETESSNVGVVYIRWGKYSCPSGAEKVYTGRMGGSHYSHKGGGANYICIAEKPKFTSSEGSLYTHVYETEYESGKRIRNFASKQDYNAPCVACYRPHRRAVLMIPAKISCPSLWNMEYRGYLMSERENHYRKVYECIDEVPQGISGSNKNTNGALLYFVITDAVKMAMRCIVCTR